MNKKDNTMKWRHYLWAVFGGLVFTVLAVVCYACWQETENVKKGGSWRWKDWSYLTLCGLAGQAAQAFLACLIMEYGN